MCRLRRRRSFYSTTRRVSIESCRSKLERGQGRWVWGVVGGGDARYNPDNKQIRRMPPIRETFGRRLIPALLVLPEDPCVQEAEDRRDDGIREDLVVCSGAVAAVRAGCAEGELGFDVVFDLSNAKRR
jgi:hypothetical protein